MSRLCCVVVSPARLVRTTGASRHTRSRSYALFAFAFILRASFVHSRSCRSLSRMPVSFTRASAGRSTMSMSRLSSAPCSIHRVSVIMYERQNKQTNTNRGIAESRNRQIKASTTAMATSRARAKGCKDGEPPTLNGPVSINSGLHSTRVPIGCRCLSGLHLGFGAAGPRVQVCAGLVL